MEASNLPFCRKWPIRFNTLLRDIEGANKQSLATALKELESEGILHKVIISEKPLHIEYNLSERGQSLVPIFQQLEGIVK
jgi:DNA-binding HxlR family transcriptional regulator